MLTARPSSPPLAQEAAGAEGRRSGRGVRHVYVARRVPGPAHCVPKPGVAVSNVLPRPRPRAARPCRGGRGCVTSSPSPSPSLFTGIGVGAGACSPALGEAGGQCSRPVSVSRPPTLLCCPAGVQRKAHRAPACLVFLFGAGSRTARRPTGHTTHIVTRPGCLGSLAWTLSRPRHPPSPSSRPHRGMLHTHHPLPRWRRLPRLQRRRTGKTSVRLCGTRSEPSRLSKLTRPR